MRKWAAIVAVIFLAAVVVGRLRLFSQDSIRWVGFEQDFAIILGTSIACFSRYIRRATSQETWLTDVRRRPA